MIVKIAESEDADGAIPRHGGGQPSPPTFNLNDGSPSIKARAYQVEMLEESVAKNVIVAMDTGSGKTHM